MTATDAQVGMIMREREKGRTQEQAAARANLIEKSSKHWTKSVEPIAIQERAFEGVGLQMRLKPIRQVWKAWDGVIMTDGTACGFPNVLLRV